MDGEAKFYPVDVMLTLICAVCGTKLYVRAANPQDARDMAMAHGWAFKSLKPPIPLCPFENPARIEHAATVEFV